MHCPKCKNIQSAMNNPVDSFLSKEVKMGLKIGPFTFFLTSASAPSKRKYSGKKCIIIDLSAPYGSTIPSVNSLTSPLNTPPSPMPLLSSNVPGKGYGFRNHQCFQCSPTLSQQRSHSIHPDFWQLFSVCW